MSALLLIGGDNLGSIPGKLKNIGFSEVIHVDGRKVKMVKNEIPERVDLILILTDFVNHNLSNKIKNKAGKKDIPICYSKRSWSCIYKSLTTCDNICEQCPFLKKC
ncbi:DUF2325 domain-containing protein [Salipaludibacillus sp. LMS25]|jgi:hypothetical protein|uniref:DUF2325 domain-containing protein n=1 Tax=Salipaludibacillus sp. LMS25 TaxID=2924031 RepID=UPI0020D190AF|nr:DUF2325 domain-containing protein [Salipaludibacillus sp. LMS25]UTR13915.1 DUF2325 domain-containing protein [Salipaludibacillus sp. LMS25]